MQPLPHVPHIGFGWVHHARVRPVQHHFTYRSYFVLLPLRSLHAQGPTASSWHINRPGALSFHERDHGDGRGADAGGALAWLLDVLHAHGIDDADGEIWLQTYPRVWGYAFKPVSFWYCMRQGPTGDALRAVVAEVNNTFGERHCYVLDSAQWNTTLHAAKVFHVSPFCEVRGSYAFCFRFDPDAGDGPRLSARVDYHDEDAQRVLNTQLQGRLQPLTPQARRHALWRYPLMTLGVIWHIHVQALRLWRRRLPIFQRPSRAPAAATRDSNSRHPREKAP